ncbi:dihydroorotase [Legionella fairfieldensis]|uniref:dihydroorotase n=1 Tax=Legionella fairfieldensis TaxID=45064 RepID=UPI00048FD697|nr:dihydroorotase [Legionella fairfieldensis]
MQTLIITQPDDWHVHFRDGLFLQHTVPATARHFSRALVMPNLKPALTTIAEVVAYRERILKVLQENTSFSPLMTLYLNENVTTDELEKIKNYPYILGAKLYPAGVTTNSEEGVRSLRGLYPLLETMQQQNLVLQIHGEITHGDIFYREEEFINTCLVPLIHNFPKLRIVLEHISTKTAVEFISQAGEQVVATITPHHLFYNRNQLFAGGLRPHYYCLPVLKKESDQNALQMAVTSGNRKFFAGTDSAPHPLSAKENACGCAGIYSAPFAVALYAQIFESLDCLANLSDFLGRFGAEFYHQPVNQTQLVLRKEAQLIPDILPLGQEPVVPVAAGETLQWSIHEFM